MVTETLTFVVKAEEVGLDNLEAKLEDAMRDIQNQAKKLKVNLESVNVAFNKVKGTLNVTANSAKKFRMELLSIMFFGMALSRMFKSYTDSLAEMFGLTDLNAAAMTMLLLPAYQEWASFLTELDLAIIGLGGELQLWIGRFVIWGQQFGNLLAWIGQISLGIQGVQKAVESLKLAGGGSLLLGIWATLVSLVKIPWKIAVTFLTTGWDILRIIFATISSFVKGVYNILVGFFINQLSFSQAMAKKAALLAMGAIAITIVLLNLDWIKQQLEGLWNFGAKQNLKKALIPDIMEFNRQMEQTGKVTQDVMDRIDKTTNDWVALNMGMYQGMQDVNGEYTYLGATLDANGDILLNFKTVLGEILPMTEAQWAMYKEQTKSLKDQEVVSKLIEASQKKVTTQLNTQLGVYAEQESSLKRIMRLALNLVGMGSLVDRLSSMNIPGFAAGGIVTQPTLAMVGEEGPEAIVPLNGNSTNFGGGITININAPISNSADARSLVDEVARLLKTRLSAGTLT